MHAFTRLIDAGVVAGSLRDIHNAVVKCLSLSTVAAYTRVLGVVTGEGPEDSSQASLEAVQWVTLYLSVMMDVTENISHNTLKCAGAPHSCSDCQWNISQQL
jgi:hypothetical protein